MPFRVFRGQIVLKQSSALTKDWSKVNESNNGKRLDGKVAFITVATGGIGEATAKRYLEEGASVMLVGRSAEKLSSKVGLPLFEMTK